MKRRRWIIGSCLLAFVLMLALVVAGCGGTTASTTVTEATSITQASTSTTAAQGSSSTTAGQSTSSSAASTEPIKIGFLVSLTGPSSAPGASIKQGFDLEIAAINAAGGINGRQIEVITVDDKSDVSGATAAMTKLIEQDKVVAVYGPFPQFATDATRAITEKAGVPQIVNGPLSLAAAKEPNSFKWSFLTNPTTESLSRAYLTIIKNGGFKNVVGVSDNLPVDQEAAQVMVEGATGSGIALDMLPDTWGIDAVDMTPIINKLVAEVGKAKPDLIFLNSNPIHFPVLVKALRNQGITTQIMGCASCGHPAIFSAGPDVVEGVIVPGTAVLGAAQLPANYPGKDKLVDFATRYMAAYNAPPDFFAGYGADAVWIIAEGLKAGGDDKPAIRDAIEALQKFPTNTGTVSYSPTDHNGYVGGDYYEWKVVGGAFVLVGGPVN